MGKEEYRFILVEKEKEKEKERKGKEGLKWEIIVLVGRTPNRGIGSWRKCMIR
jgi:hypothetical protein